jgi:hypothetical protein
MKKIHFLLMIILVGCANRNDITTQLLNDKKVVEDSITLAHNFEKYYMQQSKQEHDSLKRNLLIDSSTYFFGRGRALKNKLKAIEFSLDSLSKTK